MDGSRGRVEDPSTPEHVVHDQQAAGRRRRRVVAQRQRHAPLGEPVGLVRQQHPDADGGHQLRIAVSTLEDRRPACRLHDCRQPAAIRHRCNTAKARAFNTFQSLPGLAVSRKYFGVGEETARGRHPARPARPPAAAMVTRTRRSTAPTAPSPPAGRLAVCGRSASGASRWHFP